MPPVVSTLLAFMAALFRSHTSLRLEHLALRHQLAMYQQSVHRPQLRPTDRLFWAWLSRLWSGWQAVLALVQPGTVIAWQRQRFHDHWRQLSQQSTPGRPAVARETRELIQAMWQANPTWGSPRIVGELRKLGIDVAKSTVEMYRVRARRSPSPTWKTFLRDHVNDLIALHEQHLRRLLTGYLQYYHHWRTHRALDMDCLVPQPVQRPEVGSIREIPDVGGLHHHYERRSA